MALVAALCTQCGATVQVDSGKEAAICPYCNTPYIVEKAIVNYNTHVTNNYSGATINVSGFDIENLLELAQFSYESKDYSASVETCDKILSVDAKNYKAWELKAKSIGWVESTLLNPKCYESLQMAKKAIQFAPASEKQKIAGSLQLEICSQTIALIRIYSNLNSAGQMMHNQKLASLVNNYIEALKFPYVEATILEINSRVIYDKVCKPGNTDLSAYADNLFYEYVKSAQKNYYNNKAFTDAINEVYEKAKIENEVNFWKDYPQILNENREKIASTLEEEYKNWKEIENKYVSLKKEADNAQTIIKQNQFSLFGEGAKIRKANEAKYYQINSELAKIENEYKQKLNRSYSLESKIKYLRSI